MYALSKKKNELFDDLWWLDCVCVSVNRIHQIVCAVGHETCRKLYQLIPPDKVTKHNVKYLQRFSEEVHLLLNGDVGWGSGNHGSAEENIKEHFNKHVLCSIEGIFWGKQGIISADDYAAYAVKMFRCMERVLVHTNGSGVYLSGFADKVFIVGRYDGQYQFGISSCYYVEEGNKPGRESGLCFSVDK